MASLVFTPKCPMLHRSTLTCSLSLRCEGASSIMQGGTSTSSSISQLSRSWSKEYPSFLPLPIMCARAFVSRCSLTSVSAFLRLRVRTIDSFPPALLKSYHSHFSSYGCVSYTRAICQVTMTGAGTCKQAICIQEIALLQCAFPTSCHCKGARRRFHL